MSVKTDCTSTVKWFSSERGWGFIVDPAGGRDIWVHHTVIDPGLEGKNEQKKFRELTDGEVVRFDYHPDTPKGPRALRVKTKRWDERHGRDRLVA